MEKKNTWETYSSKQLKELEKINAQYRDFLDNGKTERECIDTIVNTIEKSGYRELESLIKEGAALKTGDKVYSVWMNKSIAMFQIGRKPMTDGMNILGAHIDSPRLDVKQNPLYEDGGFAYLDTHYYGGVKKYQWVTIPLAIHGVIVKKDGTCVEINIGENEDDPVFFVSDLLIHLAQEQLEKKAAKVIEGEALDIIVGNKPLLIDKKDKKKDEKEAGKEAVKAGVLDILKETYDIHEEDFVSAELEIVPAGKAREAGFDRSMTLAYGQDDRVCAYTSMQAMLDSDVTDRTMCCILVDKEEIGSEGNTGLNSDYVLHYIEDLAELEHTPVRDILRASLCLSSDVNAAYDPTFADVFESRNASYINKGCVLTKYTGARGKSASNDASAETMAKVIAIMEEAGVFWQAGELGAVDVGGGGTIAKYVAHMDVDTVDLGVPILSMHSPFELASKLDVYNTYKAFKAFYA